MIKDYLSRSTWKVNENSNIDYSIQGLNMRIVEKESTDFWLKEIYPSKISKGFLDGDYHIHNLGFIGPYCMGFDISDILMEGFGGVPGKVSSRPPKHLGSALGQLMNFIFSISNEVAGAVALSSLDTFLAPFIRKDRLSPDAVRQEIQEWIFPMNVSSRIGSQIPFSNIGMDTSCPSWMKEQAAILDGAISNISFVECEDEIKLFNREYSNVMLKGDGDGRPFPFPIMNLSLTDDFDWEQEELFKVTAKYGSPYFTNYISTGLNPAVARSMCCRLKLDLNGIRYRGGFFSSFPKTGGIGVVTINLPRIGIEANGNDGKFFSLLEDRMTLAKEALNLKREFLEQSLTSDSLYPYTKRFLRDTKDATGKYWTNHFSIIGLIGLNEACEFFLGKDILEGVDFAEKVLSFMKDKVTDFTKETDTLFNLEETPAEGCSYSLAQKDIAKFHAFNFSEKISNDDFYYTNSSHLPVDYSSNLALCLNHQEKLQQYYTGGCVFHTYLGEALPTWDVTSKLVKRIASHWKIPSFTITPTHSVCSKHGYLLGEQEHCPHCGSETEVYTRITGYFSPVKRWNRGKKAEFKMRKTYDALLWNPVH